MVKTEYIPKVDGYIIGSMLLDAISKYYEDPANVAKFEKWQQERKSKERREKVCN